MTVTTHAGPLAITAPLATTALRATAAVGAGR